MSKLELNELAAVREELANVCRCAKIGTILLPKAKDLAAILKTIAGVIRDEKEMDIEAELNAIREQIEVLKKGATDNAQMDA